MTDDHFPGSRLKLSVPLCLLERIKKVVKLCIIILFQLIPLMKPILVIKLLTVPFNLYFLNPVTRSLTLEISNFTCYL